MKNLYSLSLIFLFLSVLQSFDGTAQVNIINGSTTVCIDSLYDSGGQTGSYSINENFEYTISPTSVSTVTLTIDSINIALGDTLRIHDGTDTLASVLYIFTDTSVFIPTPISSTGASITVHFKSDGAATVDFGFKMHWVGNMPAASVTFTTSIVNNICVGDNVTFTPVPVNGGTTPSYQWYKNDTAKVSTTLFTTKVNNNDYIKVKLDADGAGCSIAIDSVQMSVTSYSTAAVALASSVVNNVCVGDNVTFTATPTNGGSAPNYTWYLNDTLQAGSTDTYMNNTLNDDDTVRVVMTSDFTSGCLTDSISFDSLKMNVTAYTTSSVALAATKTDLCNGDNITFTATPTNGGSSPVYEWYLNDTLQASITDTYMNNTLNDDDTVRVVMNSDFSSGCLIDSISQDSIKVNVTALTTASVSLAKSVSNVCVGNNVTFTATPTNGGAAPVYKWYLNDTLQAGSTDTYLNNTLNDDDTVRVVMASDFDGGCLIDSISFDSLKVNVTSNTIASVLVTVDDPSVCAGTNVLFTATPTNGGTPTYKWTINAGGTVSTTNTFSSSSLSDGDDVECEMTSSISTGCLIDSVSTDNIVMNINDIPSASAGSAVLVDCYGDSTGGATASGSGTVAPYTYLWDNGETTAAATMLWAGSHRVYVTDDSLCLDSADIVITENSEIIFSFTVTDASAYGASDGSISVTMSGGVSSYDHVWSTGLPANNKVTTALNGLAAGTYADTVYDHSGGASACKVWESVTVNQPGILLGGSIRINSATSKAICAGSNVGLMTNQTAAVGGIGTLNYTWQYSADLLSWTNYPSSNSNAYTLNDSITAITFVRRIAVDAVNDTASSNILFLNYIADVSINIIGLDPVYCQGDATELIIGTPNSPTPGVFSGGAHISAGGTFNPALAASSATGDPNNVIYTYTDSYGCVSSRLITTQVFDTTTGSVSIVKTIYSPADTAEVLVETGYPGGGLFTGTGVSYSVPYGAYVFDPAQVDSTLYDDTLLISYVYTATNGCESRHFIRVKVQNDQVTLRTSSNVNYFSSCGNNTSDRIVADLPVGEIVDYYFFYIYNSNYTAVIWDGLTYSGIFTDSIIYPFNPSIFNPIANTSPYNPGATPIGVNNYHVRFYYRIQGTSTVLLEKDIEIVNLGNVSVTSSYVNDNGGSVSSYFLYCETTDSSELSTTYLNLGARSVSHTIAAGSGASGFVDDHGDGTAALYPANAGLFYDRYTQSYKRDTIIYTYEDDLTGCQVSTKKNLYIPVTPPVAITTDKGNHTKDSIITTLNPDYGGYSRYYLDTNYLGDSSFVISTYRNGNLYTGTYMNVFIGDTITWDTLYITPIQSTFCSHDGYSSIKGLPWWANRASFSSSNNAALNLVSSSFADSASFTITDNAPANSWVQYKVNDVYGCTDSVRLPFTVNPVPVLRTVSNDGDEFCESDNINHNLEGQVFTTVWTNLIGDSITGPGVVNRNDGQGRADFNANVAGPGLHTNRYHFTNKTTFCYNYFDSTFIVNALPDPSFHADDTAMCMTPADNASFIYDGSSQGTSVYSLVGFGTPISNFDPVNNADISFGGNDVRHVFTDTATGCQNSDTITITVDPYPVVNLVAPGAFCYNEGSIKYSGTPVSPGNIPPNVASSFYSGTLGILDYKNIAGQDSGAYTPSLTDVGTHSLSYNYTDPITGCFNGDTTQIVINDIPKLRIVSVNGFEFCESDATNHNVEGQRFTSIWTNLVGDSITGPGIINRNDGQGRADFRASLAGPGNHAIRFHFTNKTTFCYNYVDSIITVNALPDPSFTSSDFNMCMTPIDWASFSYTGLHSGSSSYLLVGFPNDTITSFDPVDNSNIVFGPNDVRNIFVDAITGCQNSDTITITVDTFPIVNVFSAPGAFCYNGGTFGYSGTPLSPGNTPPNVASSFYSSSLGISDFKNIAGQGSGTYSPTVADIGIHDLSYNYTDPITGCFSGDTIEIEIYDIPELELRILNDPFALSLQHCLGDTVEYEKLKNGVTDIGLSSYIIGSGFADSTGTWFNPDAAGTGSHLITYKSTDSNGCYNQTDTLITVIPTSDPSFTMSANVACIDPDGFIVLTPNATPSNFGGTFKFPDIFDEVVNVSTDTFYISNAFWGGDTTYTVRYVYDVGFGCVDSMDQLITVNDTPNVAFTVIDPEYCYNQGAVTISVDAPSLGNSYFRSYLYPGYQDFNNLIDSNFLANGINSIQFTPSQIYADSTMYVDYVHVDANGCEGIAWDYFDIKDIPILDYYFWDLISGLPNPDDDNVCALEDSIDVIGEPVGNMKLPINNGWFTGSVFGQSNNLVSNNGDGSAKYGPYPLNTLSPFITDTVTYHYQDSNAYGCYNSLDVVVNIRPQPITTFSVIPSDNPNSTNICPNEKSLMSSLYDSVGLYQVLWPGANITRSWIVNDTLNAFIAKQFNPGPPGVKDTSLYNAWNHIKQTIVDKRYGCYSEYTDSIFLDSFPIVDLTFDSALYCTNSGVVVFTGSPASPGSSLPSVFTSSNISTRFVNDSVVVTQAGKDTLQLNTNDMVKPGVSSINIKNIKYTYTEPATGCTSTKSKTFKLKRAPVLALSAVNKVFCPYNNDVVVSLFVNNNPSTLQGKDTITGLGLVYPINSAGEINYNPRTFLGSLTSITDTITYTHVDSNYCTESLIDANFVVKHQPLLDLIIPPFKDSVCLEDNPFAFDIRYWSLDSNAFKSYPPLSGTSPGSGVDQNYFIYDAISPSTGPTSKSFWPLFDSKNKTDGVVTEVQFRGSYENNGCYDTLIDYIVTHPKPEARLYLDGVCGKYKALLHGDSSYIDSANFSPSDGVSRYEWVVDGYDSAYTFYNDTLVDLKWYYALGKNKVDLDLVVVSKKGCSSEKFTKEVDFLTSPDAGFVWSMGDECEGDTVEFRSDRGGVPDLPTTTYLWKFGDGDSSTVKEVVKHLFTAVDTFAVSLILTEGGSACQDTATKNIFIRPVISTYPYVNDFESAYSGWVTWEEKGAIPSDPNDPNSKDLAVYFEYGTPNQLFVKGAASGTHAFATGLDSNYTANVQTSVTSPCFDLSAVERPMIKLQTQYFVQINDGAVIQYTEDRDSTLETAEWHNIGEYFRDNQDNNLHKETGINWYDKDNIFGNPGEQPNTAGRIGWTGGDTTGVIEWQEARHSADSVAGKPYVRFRVAFGADASEETEGFAFDDFEVTERQRKVLFEGFTNANTKGGLVADIMGDYNNVVNESSVDVVDLQYHTSFPASDPMNQVNTADPSTRTLYYNIGEIPYVRVNGTRFKGLMSSKNFGSWIPKTASLLDPLFKIDMIYNTGTKVVDVDVTAIGPGASYPLDVTVHLAMVERHINYSEFTSGTVDQGYLNDGFSNVLKKMYPTASGTNKTAGYAGWSESLSATMNFDNFYDDAKYRIVAFVQDRNTKEVYQAEWVDDGKLGTEIPKYEDIVVNGVEYNLYPNPTDGTAFLEFRESLENSYEMRVYNQLGVQVLNEVIPNGTRVHQLDMGQLEAGMYFIMLNDGEHKVAIKKLMLSR